MERELSQLRYLTKIYEDERKNWTVEDYRDAITRGWSDMSAASAETQVREFAAEFPTPQVQRMIAACESGLITWADAYALAVKSLEAGRLGG
jgi:hypothetical protein